MRRRLRSPLRYPALTLCAVLLLVWLLPGVLCVPASAAEYEGKTILLHTNDVHGALEGYAALAAVKSAYESAGAQVIWLDAGDFSQGTAYVSEDRGASAVALMNLLGCSASAVGNHEFDYGMDALNENRAAADFPMLAANIFDETGAAVFPGHVLLTAASGLKLGVFGLSTPSTSTSANPVYVRGLRFAGGEELYAIASAEVQALRAEGADVIVCLAHLGVSASDAPSRSYDVMHAVDGIDVMLDAHSHTVMEAGEGGEAIQSTGTAFANIGTVVIDNGSRKIESRALVPVTADTPRDGAVSDAVKEITDRVTEKLSAVCASTGVALNGERFPGVRSEETNLGDLIADALLYAVIGQADAYGVPAENLVSVTNGGGIRASIAPGEITSLDIHTVLPFGNTLTVVTVTGDVLEEVLEACTFCAPDGETGGFPQIGGMRVTLDASLPYDAAEAPYPNSTYYPPRTCARITITEVNGRPFDADAVYGVVTNDFCSGGGDCYYAFTQAAAHYDTGILLDEAVVRYITEALGTAVGAEYALPDGRMTIRTEKPAADEAQPTRAPATGDGETIVCLVLLGASLIGMRKRKR